MDRRRLRAASYAKRFAAKEACSKALGTGLRRGVYWRDMGVANLASGKPTMKLTNGAQARLDEITPTGMQAQIDLTITDDFPLAQAIVIISAVQIGQGGGAGVVSNPEANKQAKQAPSLSDTIRENLSTLIWAAAIALVIRSFLFQPFNIPQAQ